MARCGTPPPVFSPVFTTFEKVRISSMGPHPHPSSEPENTPWTPGESPAWLTAGFVTEMPELP